MTQSAIGHVAVIGAGLMGGQIAMLAAARGHPTTVIDVSVDALTRAQNYHRDNIDLLDPADRTASLARIEYASDVAAAHGAQIVIEAIAEDLDLKRELFTRLEEVTTADTILATNSSSLRASQLDGVSAHPQRVINLHFYQPLWQKPMVEIMCGTVSHQNVLDRAESFVRGLGLLPLIVRRESTGFIANRIWRAVKKECLTVVADGVASVEDVDRSWMILNSVDIGPMARMDRIGLDVVLAIERTYHRESGLDGDAPPPMLIDMVERGELGLKSGRGFYDYPNPAFERPDFLDVSCPARGTPTSTAPCTIGLPVPSARVPERISGNANT